MAARTPSSSQDLRYPIGRYEPPQPITATNRAEWLRDLEELPLDLKHAVAGLRDDWMLGQYAWHSRHHVAHIASLRKREGW